MKTRRLFFAVWPPDAVRRGLWRSLAPAREALPGVRWVPPRRLHVTLRFMGDVPGNRLPRLVSAAGALGVVDPFEVRLSGMGTFPKRGPARIFWVGARGEALPDLRERLDRALAREGVAAEERTFHPHLTVGRAGRSRSAGDRHRAGGDVEPPELSFTVTGVHLVRSDLLPDGPRYTNVHRVALGNGGG